jgi:hypothetical protein
VESFEIKVINLSLSCRIFFIAAQSSVKDRHELRQPCCSPAPRCVLIGQPLNLLISVSPHGVHITFIAFVG